MREFQLAVLLVTLLFPVALFAQHGTAGNGYYPVAYQGDTWTGIVSSLDPRTKDISLVYTHKGKTAVFEGILAKGVRVQTNGDKQKQQILATGITVGTQMVGAQCVHGDHEDISTPQGKTWRWHGGSRASWRLTTGGVPGLPATIAQRWWRSKSRRPLYALAEQRSSVGKD